MIVTRHAVRCDHADCSDEFPSEHLAGRLEQEASTGGVHVPPAKGWGKWVYYYSEGGGSLDTKPLRAIFLCPQHSTRSGLRLKGRSDV